MSQSPPTTSGIEPSQPAARWIGVAEQILACARLFRDQLTRQIGRQELSEPEFSMMWACRRAPRAGLSQNELAAMLAVSAAHVSGLVDKLLCRGLLYGRRTRPDRRRQLWKLAPAGEAGLRAALDDLADWAAALDERLGAGGSGELAGLLDQFAQTLYAPRGKHAAHRSPLRPLPTLRHAADRKGAA